MPGKSKAAANKQYPILSFEALAVEKNIGRRY
jgi:hypothetical protein